MGEGEQVEFNLTATSVTGPGGVPVKGHALVSRIPRRSNPGRGDYRGGPPRVNYQERNNTREYTPNTDHQRAQRPSNGERNSYQTFYYNSSRIPKFQNHQQQQIQQQQQQHVAYYAHQH